MYSTYDGVHHPVCQHNIPTFWDFFHLASQLLWALPCLYSHLPWLDGTRRLGKASHGWGDSWAPDLYLCWGPPDLSQILLWLCLLAWSPPVRATSFRHNWHVTSLRACCHMSCHCLSVPPISSLLSSELTSELPTSAFQLCWGLGCFTSALFSWSSFPL